MSEEFRTLSVPQGQIESELNKLGLQGWQVVNCWSAGSGTATCILKRQLEYFCSKTKTFQSRRPLHQLDLALALARCLEQPNNPLGKAKGIRLAALGREFGADETTVFERLKEEGLRESERLKDAHSGFCEGHLLWVSHPEKEGNPLWLNAKKVEKKNKTEEKSIDPKDSEGTVPAEDLEEAFSSEAPEQRLPIEGVPSIEDLIALCLEQPLKEPGWPHGISMRALAKHFKSDPDTIHQIVNSAGIPDKPKVPKEPFEKVCGYFVKLKNSNGSLYLNVKPKPNWTKDK